MLCILYLAGREGSFRRALALWRSSVAGVARRMVELEPLPHLRRPGSFPPAMRERQLRYFSVSLSHGRGRIQIKENDERRE
jgi:hypothetical protein